MDRDSFRQLIEWKNTKKRKPLILQGAKQVGKTWLMKEFGKREYKNVAYISFDRNRELKNYKVDDNLYNIPLYMIGNLGNVF